MRKKILNILKLILFLGIGIFLVWFAFKDLSDKDLKEITQTVKNVNYFWVILSLIPAVFSHYVRALRWNMLLNASDKKANIYNTTMAVFIGYFANLVIPRMGEISRCTVLKKTDDIDLETSIGTVILERIIDTLVLAILLFILFFLQGKLLMSAFGDEFNVIFNLINRPWYIYVLSLVVGIIAFWYLFFKLDLSKFSNQLPVLKKIIGIFEGFKKGILSILTLRNPIKFIFLSFTIWFFYWLTIIVFFYALPETKHLGPMAGFTLVLLGSFAYILVQGGIGAYQLLAMQTLALYAIPANIGLAFGWVIWTFQTFYIIILGLISMLYIFYVKKKHRIEQA